MFKEFGGHILVNRIYLASSRAIRIILSEYMHIQLVESDCSRIDPSGKWCIPVEQPDIIHSQKSAFKNIISLLVFPVYPPGKIQEQFQENGFQEFDITRTG